MPVSYKSIPNLSLSRLNKIKVVIKKRTSYFNIAYDDVLIPFMQKLGFEVKYTSGYGAQCNRFYIHPKWKLIVKESLICNNKKPKHLVPTVIVSSRRESGGRICILIQPLVDTRKSAIKKATEFLPIEADFHKGNIGIFNKKPVMFDW